MTPAAVKTVGILYPGELGARVGEALAARGVAVITTLAGRSRRTARRCQQGGIVVRPALADVVREADVLLSLVPPAAAEEVARQYAELAHAAPVRALFVDLNSIAPERAGAIAEQLSRSGRGFVDGAVNGLASRFAAGGTVFLSGARAAEVAALFEGAVRVQIVGDAPGAASAMKMMLSGLSKGVCALFAELAVTAERRGMLAAMLAASSQIYPELAKLAERMLPTYAEHAERRATEMSELEATVAAAGVDPVVTAAVRQVHEQLAAVDWSGGCPSDAAAATDITTVLRRLSESDFCSAAPPPAAVAAATGLRGGKE
ncbi:MAG TPA: DUF1932 domain-containing protein [Tepidisphaeraceae bacterium]|nr:DUF1932 domain-containing protein [Tepidisphaeraceae bacterium]